MSVHGEAAIILAAAIIIASVSRRLGFGSVPGYIFAGIIIGPWGLNIIASMENILHFSEIGVVFLLFIIGLELRPARLWMLRTPIFGTGSFQVLVSTVVFCGIARLFTDSWSSAAIIGFGLSLSSTAFALQVIAERNQLDTKHGRSALHILLFQDVIAVPVLAVIPMVAADSIEMGPDVLSGVLKMVLILAFFWVFARFLLRPILRIVAATRTNELFTAFGLLLVIGSALLMESIGVSMALGAFLAGVMVADSEYRHQLEADIEPFKGLLLSLFFISVGMSANLGLFAGQIGAVLGITLLIVTVKGVILFVIGRLTRLDVRESLTLAVCLGQGGEFAFILFSLAQSHGLLATELNDRLILAVTLSMVLTPLVLFALDKLLAGRSKDGAGLPFDEIANREPRVILAGFGRFGQIISRIIRSQGICFTAIELDSGHVDFVRRMGNRVYYGDAANRKLLEVAGTGKAQIFVLAIGNVETSTRVAGIVLREYPNIRLFARARNRMHEMRLREMGAEVIIRDTLLSGMHLAEKVLVSFGIPDRKAKEVNELFFRHDAATLDRQFAYRNDRKKLMQSQREAARELEELFAEDSRTFPVSK